MLSGQFNQFRGNWMWSCTTSAGLVVNTLPRRWIIAKIEYLKTIQAIYSDQCHLACTEASSVECFCKDGTQNPQRHLGRPSLQTCNTRALVIADFLVLRCRKCREVRKIWKIFCGIWCRGCNILPVRTFLWPSVMLLSSCDVVKLSRCGWEFRRSLCWWWRGWSHHEVEEMIVAPLI